MLHEHAPRVEALPAPCDSSSPPAPLVSAPLGSRVSAPLVSTNRLVTLADACRLVADQAAASEPAAARAALARHAKRALSELADCP